MIVNPQQIFQTCEMFYGNIFINSLELLEY